MEGLRCVTVQEFTFPIPEMGAGYCAFNRNTPESLLVLNMGEPLGIGRLFDFRQRTFF